MAADIINYIASTNLFNFAIFLGIIIYIYKKLDVSGKLEAAKNSVAANIKNSETAKTDSEKVLKEIEQSVANVGAEIDEIIKKSEENADMVGNKILNDAQKSLEIIKENTGKIAEARSSLIKNDLLKRAATASVEVAKNHIINELRNNPDLHNRLIDESVEAINGIKG